MTFDWATLALQTINFLILVWLLRRFLYRPVLAAIDQRRADTLAAQERAAEAERKGQAAEQEWHRRSEELVAEAAGRRRDAEAEAASRGEAVVAEARRQAERILVEAREAVATEREAAAIGLKAQAGEVATVLAARLLDVVAPGVGAAPFLVLLAERLSAMDPAERALLGTGPKRIEVAPPLSAEAQEEWTRRLAGVLGEVSFADAPGLIAGARLATGSAALEVSWAEALVRAQEGIGGDGKSD